MSFIRAFGQVDHDVKIIVGRFVSAGLAVGGWAGQRDADDPAISGISVSS
jgi:hypothetical protein